MDKVHAKPPASMGTNEHLLGPWRSKEPQSAATQADDYRVLWQSNRNAALSAPPFRGNVKCLAVAQHHLFGVQSIELGIDSNIWLPLRAIYILSSGRSGSKALKRRQIQKTVFNNFNTNKHVKLARRLRSKASWVHERDHFHNYG